MKTKILTDFHICIGVPLRINIKKKTSLHLGTLLVIIVISRSFLKGKGPQLTLIFLKVTIETLQKGVAYVQS